jgi:hypothetical protein
MQPLPPYGRRCRAVSLHCDEPCTASGGACVRAWWSASMTSVGPAPQHGMARRLFDARLTLTTGRELARETWSTPITTRSLALVGRSVRLDIRLLWFLATISVQPRPRLGLSGRPSGWRSRAQPQSCGTEINNTGWTCMPLACGGARVD